MNTIKHLGKAASLLLFFFVFIAASDGGCKRKSETQVSASKPASVPRTADFLMKKAGDNFPKNLKYYNAKAGLKYKGKPQSFTASAHVVWEKDAFLWMAVKKFGFEAVRVKITPDSVYVLNRLENTYMARSMDFLEQEYNLQGGFEMLSAMLLGHPYFPRGMDFETEIKDSLYVLNGKQGVYSAEYKMTGGNFSLTSSRFAQPLANRYMTMDFENKQVIGKVLLPTLIEADAYLEETDDISLKIDLRDIELNEKTEVKFEVPRHYERI